MTIRSIKTSYWDRGKPTQRLGVRIKNDHGYLFIEPEDVVEVSNRLVDWLEETCPQHDHMDEKETP